MTYVLLMSVAMVSHHCCPLKRSMLVFLTINNNIWVQTHAV